MNTNLVIEALKDKGRGEWFNIQWKTDLPLTAAAKKSGSTGYKICAAQCRKDITYANQKAVKEKVVAGKVLTHELPWGQWKEGHEGVLITHKGNDYLRVYMGPNKPKVNYYVNGQEMDYQQLKDSGLIQESFFKPKEKADCLTVKTANIQAIINKKKTGKVVK